MRINYCNDLYNNIDFIIKLKLLHYLSSSSSCSHLQLWVWIACQGCQGRVRKIYNWEGFMTETSRKVKVRACEVTWKPIWPSSHDGLYPKQTIMIVMKVDVCTLNRESSSFPASSVPFSFLENQGSEVINILLYWLSQSYKNTLKHSNILPVTRFCIKEDTLEGSTS
jgi:hypothetical protein